MDAIIQSNRNFMKSNHKQFNKLTKKLLKKEL